MREKVKRSMDREFSGRRDEHAEHKEHLVQRKNTLGDNIMVDMST